jgi:hypothetical protein
MTLHSRSTLRRSRLSPHRRLIQNQQLVIIGHESGQSGNVAPIDAVDESHNGRDRRQRLSGHTSIVLGGRNGCQPPLSVSFSCRRSRDSSSLYDMATTVLRVRLIGGDRMDITYDEPDVSDEDELIEHVIVTLAEDSGVLRSRHGDRLVVLYGRGVAAIEVAPRGAVL